MKNTSHFSIPYPEGSDHPKDMPAHLQKIAEAVDNVMFSLDPDNPVNPPLAARVSSLESRMTAAENALSSLAVRVAATAVRSETFAINAAASVSIPMTAIEQTGGATLSAGGIKIPRSGTYLISGKVMFQASGGWRTVLLAKNGVTIPGTTGATNYLDVNSYLEASFAPVVVTLAANDVVTMVTDGGTAVSVRSATAPAAWTALTVQQA